MAPKLDEFTVGKTHLTVEYDDGSPLITNPELPEVVVGNHESTEDAEISSSVLRELKKMLYFNRDKMAYIEVDKNEQGFCENEYCFPVAALIKILESKNG